MSAGGDSDKVGSVDAGAVNASNYKLEHDQQPSSRKSGFSEENKLAPSVHHEKAPHVVATTLFDKTKDSRNSEAKLLHPTSKTALIQSEGATQDTRQEKFAEFLRTEKLKKYKRVPRVYQKRTPQPIKCPNCSKERQTRTRFETTGSQWCTCIVCCWLGCYLTCCVPFCCKSCFNVKHVCQECFYQIGESGF